MTATGYDYVIVGAGSAGCLIAERLSADPACRVLLLEAGGEPNTIWHRLPVGYYRTMYDPRTSRVFETEAEAGTAGRRIRWPRGRVVGGSSAINGLIWIRGDSRVYDRWGEGAPGWSAEEAGRLFRKVEGAEGPPSQTRGAHGMLRTARLRDRNPQAEAWLHAATAWGLPETDDLCAQDGPAVGRSELSIHGRWRMSSARAHLQPVRHRPNLSVRTGALARRVVIEKGRATGVEWIEDGETHAASAEREVILTAGAIQSPQLLQLSGLGPAETLRAAGVEVLADMPEIGGGLQDHYQMRLVLRMKDRESLNLQMRSPLWLAKAALDWALFARGPLTIGAGQIGATARTSHAPGDWPDVQLMAMPFSTDAPGSPPHPFPGFTALVWQCHPESRGRVDITSDDPRADPRIRPQLPFDGTRPRHRRRRGAHAARDQRPGPLRRPDGRRGRPRPRGAHGRGDPRGRPPHRLDGLPPLRHGPHGLRRRRPPRPRASCEGDRGPARRRRLRHAGGARREHQRARDDGGREGRRTDPGRLRGRDRMAYETLELLVDGKWRAGSTGKTEPVIEPATGETLAEVPHASTADLDEALAASAKGFETWRRTPPIQRQKVMEGAARILESRADEIAANLTREMGKPVGEAKLELGFAIDVLRWYGEEGKRVYGRTVPSRIPGMRQTVQKEPVGPSLAFVAWNFPAVNVMRKVAGALGAGCSLIIKPSEETPATAVAIGRALTEAGLPEGVLQIVFGVPAEVSEHLLASPIPKKLSFTGSVPVGKHLQKLAADTLKRCTMELGGHAPVLVFDDADVEKAAKAAAAHKFRNAGQVCISPTRFIVQENAYDRFADAFVKEAEALKVGNGLEDGVQMGPLIADRRLGVMEDFTADAVSHGAKLRTGGERMGNKGTFWAPTVMTDVPRDAKIMNEEPFGPLAPMMPVKSVDDAIEEANRLTFGLAAYAFTTSGKTANKLAESIESGLLAVNSTVVSTPETPFGGVNESGYGSEGGTEGIEAFLRTKLVTETEV